MTKRKKPYNEKHIIGFLFGVCLTLTLFLGSLLFALYQLDIPDIRSVSHYRPAQTTLLFDKNGSIVEQLSVENRFVVPLNKMHQLLPKAFVAAEDGRFFEHPGLDSFSVLRALINNLREGRKSQGGSTITQQVAKGLLLSPEKTYLRKFKEAILAWRIDKLLSKDEIIYIYLNQIYLGEGAYGVEAASRTYFNKTAEQLTLGEIALLAGLPQAPSRYSPFDHLQKARSRQRYVLNRMAADGYISDSEAREAYSRKVRLAGSKKSTRRSIYGYYLQEVKSRVEQMVGGNLETAGLRVYTNLDPSLQVKAGLAVRDGVIGVQKRQRARGIKKPLTPEAALVCLEACTGRVRAVTGGSDFIKTPFNRAIQARRPAGSVFKPIVYATAFERGWSPSSIIVDEPVSIKGKDGESWQPKNFSGRNYGKVSLSQALVYSYNIPVIKLMQQIGVKPVMRKASLSGISSDLPSDLSLALGAADVSLLEMSSAYQPFICQGQFTEPRFIDRVTDAQGKVLYQSRPNTRKVMNSNASVQVKTLLAQVISEGTGKKAQGVAGRSGGKTGTSDKNRDAWFIGYNNNLITGVWVGNDKNQSLGEGENGGSTAAPIWKNFLLRAGKK